MYTIGRLARRAGVNADSIRFYERQGLLTPASRTDTGYRLYTEDAEKRLRGAVRLPCPAASRRRNRGACTTLDLFVMC